MKTTPAVLMMLFTSLIGAASNAGVVPKDVSTTGVTVTVTPEPNDACSTTVCMVWMGALYQGRWYLRDTNDNWQPYNGGPYPIAGQVSLAGGPRDLQVFAGLDISGLSGLELYVGYGVSEHELLNTPGHLAKVFVTAPSLPSPGSGCVTGFKMYSSSSPSGPWSSQAVTVVGADALCLVDPSPVRMPDGTILLYYAMAADNALTDMPRIGVAQSTDNGVSFTHNTVAYTAPTGSVTDPFPMMLDASGTIRLLFSPRGPSVLSVAATDGTGLHFASTLDPGSRANQGGVPGALKIGSTYYLYVNGIDYYTSSDGLNFSIGGSTGLSGDSPSPIDAGGGTYLMSYTCVVGSNASTNVSCIASSTDGRTWTDIGQIGAGSVPGLVKDANGVLRIYVVSFPGQ